VARARLCRRCDTSGVSTLREVVVLASRKTIVPGGTAIIAGGEMSMFHPIGRASDRPGGRIDSCGPSASCSPRQPTGSAGPCDAGRDAVHQEHEAAFISSVEIEGIA